MAGRSMVGWVGIVISGLVGAMLTVSAVMKFVGGADLEQGFAHLQLPLTLRTTLGVIELGCVAVYALPRTAVLGAILITGYLGGAIVTHLRIDEPVWAQLGLGVAAWAGVWLRDARLRALLPLLRGPAGGA